MFSIGNDELDKKPLLEEYEHCPKCNKLYKIHYSDKILKDGSKERDDSIAFITCDKCDATYLVGIKGKRIWDKQEEMGKMESIEKSIDNIYDRYWCETEQYLSEYYYDDNNKEYNMVREIKELLQENQVEFLIEQEDGFDSAGYSNSFMAVSYIVDGKLGLQTFVFECM